MSLPADPSPTVAIVPETLDATDGAATPFGKRRGGDVIHPGLST